MRKHKYFLLTLPFRYLIIRKVYVYHFFSPLLPLHSISPSKSILNVPDFNRLFQGNILLKFGPLIAEMEDKIEETVKASSEDSIALNYLIPVM